MDLNRKTCTAWHSVSKNYLRQALLKNISTFHYLASRKPLTRALLLAPVPRWCVHTQNKLPRSLKRKKNLAFNSVLPAGGKLRLVKPRWNARTGHGHAARDLFFMNCKFIHSNFFLMKKIMLVYTDSPISASSCLTTLFFWLQDARVV